MNEESITFTELDIENMRKEEAGGCISCGAWAHNVGADAQDYECCFCGKNSVQGPEELGIMGMVEAELDGNTLR